MKNKKQKTDAIRFKIDEKLHKINRMDQIVNTMEKTKSLLENDIQEEQTRTGINDPNNFAYSTFAKASQERIVNIVYSLNTIKKRKEKELLDLDKYIQKLRQLDHANPHRSSKEEQSQF